MIIYTNGKSVRAYVGSIRVSVDQDGNIDPLERALAQLRLDCETDRRRLMRDFRWWIYEGLRQS